MAVYVDDAKNRWGRFRMAHMWADTRAELIAMADRIGLQRRWIREPPKARWLHVLVCQDKRARAIACGAIPTDRYGAIETTARRRGHKTQLATIAARRADDLFQRIEEPAHG